MKSSLLLIIFLSLVAVAIVAILFIKNQKDRKELENQLNQDYKRPKDDHGDVETEDKNQV